MPKNRRHAAGTAPHTPQIHHRGRTRHHSASPYTYSHHHAHVFTPIRVSTRIFAYMSAHERHGGTRPTPSLASAQPGTTPGPGPTDRAPARSSPGLPTPPHPLGPPGAARTNTWHVRAPRLGPARGRPGGRRRRLQRSENATRTAATGANPLWRGFRTRWAVLELVFPVTFV